MMQLTVTVEATGETQTFVNIRPGFKITVNGVLLEIK